MNACFLLYKSCKSLDITSICQRSNKHILHNMKNFLEIERNWTRILDLYVLQSGWSFAAFYFLEILRKNHKLVNLSTLEKNKLRQQFSKLLNKFPIVCSKPLCVISAFLARSCDVEETFENKYEWSDFLKNALRVLWLMTYFIEMIRVRSGLVHIRFIEQKSEKRDWTLKISY